MIEKHFIKVPCISRLGATSTQLIGILLAELETPLAHCFVGHDDTTFGQQLFYVAVAQVEAIVQPDGVADDLL